VPAAARPVATAKFSEFELAKATSADELRFQSGDSIRVSIWGYPELDHTGAVQPNGKITLPLVGEVEAAGASVGELRQRITERLAAFTRISSTQLRPGDSLTMIVWQQNDLRHTATIEPDGTATFPLAGRFTAIGRDTEDIRKEVEGRMLLHLRDARVSLLPAFANRRVLYDHQVSVLAARIEPRRIAVIGEVNSQGLAEIKGSLRIVEALAQAQVRQTTAEMNSVVVIRSPNSGAPQYRMIRLDDYFAGRAPDQNIYLQHDDIVIVPKSAIAKVGDFVELFFTRTAPVFNWWAAAWQASVADKSAETTKLINESLNKSLLNISVQ
jgi:polysaccharide export outer membrane protein